MQTSMVFSQRTWPGVGDLDDCWVLSSLQCVNCSAPWLYLPNSDVFRHAAGDPDDGKKDGGSIAEIVKGVTTLYPEFKGKLTAIRGETFATLRHLLAQGRPVSVALSSGKLPAAIRYGKGDVPHQATLVEKGDQLLFANPMAPMGSKWDRIDWGDVRPAILDYGAGKVFGVAFPDDNAMVTHAPGFAAALASEIAKLPKPDCTAARLEGFNDAKDKAQAAVAGIAP